MHDCNRNAITGRPKKGAAVKLSAMVKVRLTEQEADQLYLRARVDRMDLSPWIRALLKKQGCFETTKNTPTQQVK